MLSVAQHNLITNPWKNTNYQLPPPLQRTSNRSRPRSLIILESECVGKGQQIFFIFTPDHELLLLWTREIERERAQRKVKTGKFWSTKVKVQFIIDFLSPPDFRENAALVEEDYSSG